MDLEKRFPIYSRLLRLYPNAYRERYQTEMLRTLADMLDGAATEPERFRIWVRSAVDLPLSIAQQNLITAGEVMAMEMPSYIKVSGWVSGWLLMPFFAALTANLLDRVLYGHNLYHSWLWSYPVAALWVMILPAVALAVSASAFAVHMIRQAGNRSRRGWRAWIVCQDWPVMTAGTIALAILLILFFHDSVHCFVQNPITTLNHWGQTLSCARRG